jgi:poly(3-hydroxybutyrate) depolymerase
MRSNARRRRRGAAVLAAVTALLTVFAVPPARSAPIEGGAVPDRSQVYDRVDAAAGCGAVAGTRTVDGDLGDWPGALGGVNGTGYYAGGEYDWTDYTYDDAGTGQLLYPGEGELVEPEEGSAGRVSPLLNRYGGSAADIVEARIAADDGFVHLGFALSFLNAVDTTVVAVGFDVDGDPADGAAAWPLGAGLTSPGVDVFVTAHPTADGFCATLTTATGDVALDAAGGAAALGTATNAIEVAVPRAALGGADHVRVVAGSGLWDGDTQQWKRPVKGATSPAVPEEVRAGEPEDVRGGATDADPGVFNLLFRGDEDMVDPGNATEAAEPSSKRAFEYLRQAAVLLTGTSGPYALDLDLARVEPGAPAEPVPTDRNGRVEFTRQYRSRVDLEGLLWVENDISRDVIYLGARQSYAVHLPPCLVDETVACPPAGVPVMVTFHGGSGSHVNELEDFAAHVSGPMGERAQVMTLAPFGRGRRAPWWRGLGELDVLEAIADAEAAYPVDDARLLAAGGSLGGYATLRFASLYPDRWAGAAAFCPATYENSTSTREPGNEVPETQQFTVFPLLGSLANTPMLQVSGTIDPLVRIDNGHRLRDRLLEERVDLRYTEWVNGHHCTWVPETQQRYPDWHVPEMLRLLERGRDAAPAVVRYASDPRQLVPGDEWLGVAHLDDVGVHHDGAWWVSAIRLRDDVIAAGTRPPAAAVAGNDIGGAGDGVVGTVAAVSHMLSGWSRAAAACGDEIGLAGVSGNPDVEQTPGGLSGTSIPEPHHFVCQRQVRSTPALEPVLDLDVENLASLAIDTVAAGIDGDVTVLATGDGDTTVVLAGTRGRFATGPCVTAQRAVATGLSIDLDLDGTACELVVARGRP